MSFLSFFRGFHNLSSLSIRDMASYIGYGMLILLAASNITSFHLIPLWYSDIIAGKTDVFILTVQRAQGLPFFEILTDEIRTQLARHDQDIFAKKHSRELIIDKLTSALAVQPNSTQLLHALMVLYREDGDEERARFYLQELQKLDPTLIQ
jgi:hypothetical protein